MQDWAPNGLAGLYEWLDHVPVIDSDADIAATWGELAAAGAKRGRSRPQNDTWIAACCLVYDMPLATLNVRDFQDFIDHDVLRLFRLAWRVDVGRMPPSGQKFAPLCAPLTQIYVPNKSDY